VKGGVKGGVPKSANAKNTKGGSTLTHVVYDLVHNLKLLFQWVTK